MKKSITIRVSILASVVILGILTMLAVHWWQSTHTTGNELPMEPFADYPYYSDVSSLVSTADTIVEGMVIDVKKNQSIDVALEGDPLFLDFTVSTIEITNALRGSVDIGEQIEVMQLNGWENNDYREMGDDGIFFLCDYRDLKPDAPFSEVNPEQGFLEIVDGNYVKPLEGNVLFRKDEAEGLRAQNSDGDPGLMDKESAYRLILDSLRSK